MNLQSKARSMAAELSEYGITAGAVEAELVLVWRAAARESLSRFAWWKDGTQYVGTCGTTLREALGRMEHETRPLGGNDAA